MEGKWERKSCSALSVSISTSTCRLWVCHLKAFLLNEIKSMFNKIKDKKKYEVWSEKKLQKNCMAPENARKLCLSNECLDVKHYFLLCVLENFFLAWTYCYFVSWQCCDSFRGKHKENCEEILWLNSAGLWRNSTGSEQEITSIWEETMERNWWLCTKVRAILSSMSSIRVPNNSA